MKTIKLKNNSTRLHHIGGVSIVPGGEGEVPEIYKDSFNKQELEVVSGASAVAKKPAAFTPTPPAPLVAPVPPVPKAPTE